VTQSKGEMSRQALYQQIETRILKEMHKILGQSLDEGPHDNPLRPHDNPLSTLSSLAYVLEIVATASATRIARTQEN